MSDGPWKTLNMSGGWRRVASSAEMGASSTDEVAQKVRQALVDDFREVPAKLFPALRRAFGLLPSRRTSLVRTLFGFDFCPGE